VDSPVVPPLRTAEVEQALRILVDIVERYFESTLHSSLTPMERTDDRADRSVPSEVSESFTEADRMAEEAPESADDPAAALPTDAEEV
jgi:hypothetical protein